MDAQYLEAEPKMPGIVAHLGVPAEELRGFGSVLSRSDPSQRGSRDVSATRGLGLFTQEEFGAALARGGFRSGRGRSRGGGFAIHRRIQHSFVALQGFPPAGLIRIKGILR